MDRGTSQELDNLLQRYWEALHQIELAADDAQKVAAWRKVQTLGWRLHELLPAVMESLPA
jgi:hypothetical protein